MFEKETEHLIATIRQTTIGDGKAVSLRAIFESKIPPNAKVFFRAEVESFLEEDRTVGKRSSKFDRNTPEIEMLLEQIDALLIHNFVFNRSDFEASLDKCVHFLFNYLCRPQWTLLSFLFDETQRTSARQLHLKLRYCRDYEYFPDILRRYVNQRNIGELTAVEGRSLLEKIDSEVIRNHSSEELASMAKPLFDFVAYARSHNDVASPKTIPTRALMYFFEDKKMRAIQERIAREREVGMVKEMSFSQLVNLLEKVRTGNESVALVDETAEPYGPGDDVSLEPPSLTGVRRENAAPLRGIVEPPKPLPPLFSLEEERSIIKNVFHQNEEEFRKAMKEALEAQSWDDSAHTIDHFFLMNDVEPFTKEAILFTNRLQDRFSEQMRKS